MFARTNLKGISRVSVRFQSNKDSSSLLDIFKRIDLITSKAVVATDNKIPGKSTKGPRPFTVRPTGTKVQVSNHPLKNSLGQNNQGRPRQFVNRQDGTKPDGTRQFKPRQPHASTAGTPSAGGEKPQITQESRQSSQPRASRPARTPRVQNQTQTAQVTQAPQTQAPRTLRKQSPRETTERLARAPTKKLEIPSSVEYTINGDTFLYGKIASVNPCVTSRVASITKEALVNSKYPYLVPRELIEQAPESANKFLLQKNYSLEVDVAQLQSRFEAVVKGKIDDVEFETKGKPVEALKEADFTKLEILKNGSLGVAQRQLLFDAVNGVKSPKELIAGACWVKK